jgi:Ribbon-helix-helix protein, copG family
MARKNKGGRPPRHEGERLTKHRTFRCRGGLDEQLEEEARTTGRSVSETIERMLMEVFAHRQMFDHWFGGDADEILRLIRTAMMLEMVVPPPGVAPGSEGAENFRVAVNAIIAAFKKLPLELPPPEKRIEGLRTAKRLLLRSSKKGELPPEIIEAPDWDDVSPPSGEGDDSR